MPELGQILPLRILIVCDHNGDRYRPLITYIVETPEKIQVFQRVYLKFLFLTNRHKIQTIWRPVLRKLHSPFTSLLNSPRHWSTWICYQFLHFFLWTLCYVHWLGSLWLAEGFCLSQNVTQDPDQRHRSFSPLTWAGWGRARMLYVD